MIDLSSFPSGPIRILPASDRITSLVQVLEGILESERLSLGQAGKLFGKLNFLASQYFGRLGRAFLRAYSRRQHELTRFALNPQIIAATRFWLENIHTLKPREVPVSLADQPVFVSYSESEGEGAGLGIALWCPCGQVVGGYMQLPDEVRSV